jgi:hypothetical protein
MEGKLDNAFKMASDIADRILAVSKHSGFVYVLVSPTFPDYVKIGRAKDLRNRLSSYQTSNPYRDFEYYFTIPVEDTRPYEKHFYKMFSSNHKMSHEWYQIEPNQAKDIIISLYDSLTMC